MKPLIRQGKFRVFGIIIKSVFFGGGWGEGRRQGCFVFVFSKRKVIVFVFYGVVCLLFSDCLFILVMTTEVVQLLPSNMSDSLQLPISLSNKARHKL